jgi:hypothetical protein
VLPSRSPIATGTTVTSSGRNSATTTIAALSAGLGSALGGCGLL